MTNKKIRRLITHSNLRVRSCIPVIYSIVANELLNKPDKSEEEEKILNEVLTNFSGWINMENGMFFQDFET
jgi:hypothetical protein